MERKVTVAVVGLGGRGSVYAECEALYSEEMEIVAIADIIPEKVEKWAKKYNIPKERCFSSAEELLKEDRLADVMFICTQDRQHVGHAIPALEKGYHLLLEKPISPDPAECKRLAEIANRHNRHVVVCHVLRYTPFYQKIKEIIDSGRHWGNRFDSGHRECGLLAPGTQFRSWKLAQLGYDEPDDFAEMLPRHGHFRLAFR